MYLKLDSKQKIRRPENVVDKQERVFDNGNTFTDIFITLKEWKDEHL